MKIEIAYVDVTPEMAAKWLAAHRGVRRPSAIAVEQFSRAMATGKWKGINQPITFDENGRIFDGLCRLAAVVKAGVTVRMTVMWGAKRSSAKMVTRSEQRWTSTT